EGAALRRSSPRAASNDLAGASVREKSGERYDLCSSVEPSFMPSLKFLMALPTPLPSCGRRFAPKINTTITRITRSSGKPRLPMAHYSLKNERRLYHFERTSRQARPSSAVLASDHLSVLYG